MHEAKGSRGHATDNEWMDKGSCRSSPPSTFFPSDGIGVIAAQRICEGCPVKMECLEHALVNRIDHGVWGGASERQRRRLLKSRSVAASTASPRSASVA